MTKFDGVIQSGFWVVPNITSASLCKPIHDTINYSTSICPFESRKCGKEEQKLSWEKWISWERKELFRRNKKHCS